MVRRIAPNHLPVFRHGEVLKCGIVFTREESSLVGQVAVHRIHRGGGVGLVLGVGLCDRSGVFLGGGERQALQVPFARTLALNCWMAV